MPMSRFSEEEGENEKKKEEEQKALPHAPDSLYDTIGNATPKSINPLQSWAEQARAAQEAGKPSEEEESLREQATQYEASPDDPNAVLMSRIAGIIGKGASEYSRAFTGGADQSKGFDDAAKLAEERLKYKENFRKQLLDKAGAMAAQRKERQQMAITGLQAGITAQEADEKQKLRAQQQELVPTARAEMLNKFAKTKGQEVDFATLTNQEAEQLVPIISKLDSEWKTDIIVTTKDGKEYKKAVTYNPMTGERKDDILLGTGEVKSKDKPMNPIAIAAINKRLRELGQPELPITTTQEEYNSVASAIRLRTGDVPSDIGGQKIQNIISTKVSEGKPQIEAEKEAFESLTPAQKSKIQPIVAKVIKDKNKDTIDLQELQKSEDLVSKASDIAATSRMVKSIFAKSIGKDAGALSNQDLDNLDIDVSAKNKLKQYFSGKFTGTTMTPEDKAGFLKILSIAKDNIARNRDGRAAQYAGELNTALPGAPTSWLEPERFYQKPQPTNQAAKQKTELPSQGQEKRVNPQTGEWVIIDKATKQVISRGK